MTTELFTVFDSAAEKFLEPFHAPTIEYALRQFRSTLTDPQHMFAKYPEDYTLFHIGTFSLETGRLEGLSTPHSLGIALTFMPEEHPHVEIA